MEKLCQLDRETFKEIDIKSIGKQLVLLTNVKSLFGMEVLLIKFIPSIPVVCS